jgi:hypothetical protein
MREGGLSLEINDENMVHVSGPFADEKIGGR